MLENIEILILCPVTAENLHLIVALAYYARMLFVLRLMPLLTRAKSLSRVVDVGVGGGREGKIDPTDFQAMNLPLLSIRAHIATLNTLGLECLAVRAPTVSFIHAYPGTVITPLLDHYSGILGVALRTWLWLASRWLAIPLEESGERNLFLSTSARYPPSTGTKASGVRLIEGMMVARGTYGKTGGGVYSLNWDGESLPENVGKLLANYRDEGMLDKIWEDLESVFKRTTGKADSN